MNRFLLVLLTLVLGACTADRGITAPEHVQASHDVRARPGVVLEIKFHETLGVRPDAVQRLRSNRGASLAALLRALERMGAHEVQPLFTLPSDRLDQLTARARSRSGEAVPDLASWHRLVLPPGTDVEAAIAALASRPEVEHVYLAPEPVAAPGSFTTPSFAASQSNYFGAAPSGIEAEYVRTLAGGRGAGVRVVDLEYSWHFGHEDLLLSPTILIAGQQHSTYSTDHGTAVLGILAGKDNGFGVTGAVPDAIVRVAGAMHNGSYNPANAITSAASQLSYGDVILLEQQAKGPPADTLYIPLEWIISARDAIKVATQAGITVVQAAGNGGRNLDAAVYNGRFNRNVYNSGAIIVGAGNASNARLSFSSYGSRVDVQAHGQLVTTTGYGDLWGSSLSEYYTGGFSGTSSASAIVASAAVALQGYESHRGRPRLTPSTLAAVLKATGSPQTGTLSQNIGPKPNLRAAVAHLDAQIDVYIDGYDNIRSYGTHAFEAMPSGGTGTYTYLWTFQHSTGTFQSTSKVFSWTFGPCDGEEGFNLDLTVTSGSATAQASTILDVQYQDQC